MTAPTFVAAGTGATDAAGAWSYTCGAPGAAGRLIIVQMLQDGDTGAAVAVTGATNIEDLAGTDNQWTQGYWDTLTGNQVGNPRVARNKIWLGRSLSPSPPPISGTTRTPPRPHNPPA